MENSEISGVGYQQGTLAGYEVREFLLEKWKRTCAYCGAKDTKLEIEHIQPRSKGGSNRVSNLCLACLFNEGLLRHDGHEEMSKFLVEPLAYPALPLK